MTYPGETARMIREEIAAGENDRRAAETASQEDRGGGAGGPSPPEALAADTAPHSEGTARSRVSVQAPGERRDRARTSCRSDRTTSGLHLALER